MTGALMVDGRYEPGNGTAYALLALEIEPGAWPGTKGMTMPVLLAMEGAKAHVFEIGDGTLHGNYVADRLRVGFCDGAAIVKWLRSFPGAGFESISGCGCGRHDG